jgi:hypothetical protein
MLADGPSQQMKKSNQCQRWAAEDCFAIPLADGGNLLGQVITSEPAILNSVRCALFDQRFLDDLSPSPDHTRIFSIVLTTRDLLDSGVWKVIRRVSVEEQKIAFSVDTLRKTAFDGAKVIGSRNIGEFANAYCRFAPWDDWADPQYLDRLLISPEKKPADLIYKKVSEILP